MNIIKKKEGSTLNIAIEGRLDTSTSPELDKVLNDNLDGVTELIFDFTGLDYISSAGLRILLSSQKRMNRQGTLKVRNIKESIMEIFEVTGFSDILDIE